LVGIIPANPHENSSTKAFRACSFNPTPAGFRAQSPWVGRDRSARGCIPTNHVRIPSRVIRPQTRPFLGGIKHLPPSSGSLPRDDLSCLSGDSAAIVSAHPPAFPGRLISSTMKSSLSSSCPCYPTTSRSSLLVVIPDPEATRRQIGQRRRPEAIGD
jgi:hypothetical protein